MRKVFCAIACCAVMPLLAEVTVTSKIVRQRWPFGREIDVWFELCGVTDPVDLVVAAKSGATPLEVPAAAVSGDIYELGNGPHHLVINPLAMQSAGDEIADFSVTLSAVSAKTYMIVDLDPELANTVAARVSYSDRVLGSGTNASGGPAWDDDYKKSKLVLRRILPGTFVMGSPSDEQYRVGGTAETQRHVRISKPFYVGVFELTQAQLRMVRATGSIFSYFSGNGDDDAQRPVDNLKYNDVGTCLSNLNSLFGGGMSLRMPTAAEWEYACRAGTAGAVWTLPVGATASEFQTAVRAVGNVNRHKTGTEEVSLPSTTPSTEGGTKHVGLYPPNPWGLYDMLGNVCEYCSDYYDKDWNGGDFMVDPTVTTTDNLTDEDKVNGAYGRVSRGSAWDIATTSGQSSYTCWQLARAGARFCVRPTMTKESTMHEGERGLRIACSMP